MLAALALITLIAEPYLAEIQPLLKSKFAAAGFVDLRANVYEPEEVGSNYLNISGLRHYTASFWFTVSVVPANWIPPRGQGDPWRDIMLDSEHNSFRTDEIGEKAAFLIEKERATLSASIKAGRVFVEARWFDSRWDPNIDVQLPRDTALLQSFIRQAVSRASGYGLANTRSEGEDMTDPLALSQVRGLPGLTVTGDAESDSIELQKGTHRLVFHVGSTKAEFDGSTVHLKKPLPIKGAEVWLPRSLVARLN